MEVKGYADAAKWVYGQALKPRQSDGSLLMLTEVRWIHQAALGPVWEVAPHPYATPKEAPGSFREHDVAEFPGGMRPPSWTEVAGAMRDWVRHAGALRDVASPSRRSPPCTVSSSGSIRSSTATAVRDACSSISCWSASATPRRSCTSAIGRGICERCDLLTPASPGRSANSSPVPSRQPLPLHRAGCRRPETARAPRCAADRGVSEDALRMAASRGRLRAHKGHDGQWRSSRASVDEYKAARQLHPRRSPAK